MNLFEELQDLKNLGLQRIYMGLESGHEKVLKRICKGAGPEEMIRAAAVVRKAGIFLSITVLLGIGGVDYSEPHARETAAVLNRMQPNQIAVLTLMPLANTPLYRHIQEGKFQLPDRGSLFHELRTLISCLDVPRTQFHANHASNYFILDGRLPRDREKFIDIVDMAANGEVSLKPEQLRAL